MPSAKGDGLTFKGGTPDEPNDFSDNTAITNGKNGILVGVQPDANIDSGGNKVGMWAPFGARSPDFLPVNRRKSL
jgi:hypothetical protein